MLDKNNEASLEKYSSAVSLSDMEIFIFPELMFSLVLANIMSPVIWKWKKDPWFSGIEKMNTNKKLQRIKQYIMNNYDFNLDLDTWGLTNKDKELTRFKAFVDLDTLSQSNALFGYEGDKYYFDMDIRKHFGLDKYTTDTIPYWKTETVESMSSFFRKEGYTKGAGECVSFSTLYYAALYIIGGFPLEDIFMIATPLHSQNFLTIGTGVITNNRRIVTYNMWFNGTEISMKARRAIENEQITFVSNNEGYVHRIYDEATMPKATYERFSNELTTYLESKVDYASIASFLRNASFRQVCFQFEHQKGGKTLYIEAEKVFPYEHGSPYLIGSNTQEKLLDEIDSMEYYTEPIEGRVSLKEVEKLFGKSHFTIDEFMKQPELLEQLTENTCSRITGLLKELLLFCKTTPKLPSDDKKWLETEPIILAGLETREAVIDYLKSKRDTNEMAALAFMAYRDVNNGDMLPFMKAAIERNPVTVEETQDLEIAEVYDLFMGMEDESIYSENRLGQPDEVWNFKTGDGLEKAIALFDVAINRGLTASITKEKEDEFAQVIIEGKEYSFKSQKKVDLHKEDYTELIREK